MIDIFGLNGAYANPFELVYRSLLEFGTFFLHIGILLCFLLLSKRLRKKPIFAGAAALAMPVIQILYVWSVSIRTEFFFSASLAFLLLVQFWILRLFPLETEDYLFLFSALLFPNRLFNSTSSILGDLWLFWILFCVCYVTAKVGLGKLRGNHFGCYFLYLFLAFSAYLYHLFVLFLHPYFTGWIGRAAGLICVVSLLMCLLVCMTVFVRICLFSQLEKMNNLSRRYVDIERYFFAFSILILALCTLIFLPFSLLGAQNALVLLLFPALCIVFLLVQFVFILLLFRVAFYKDSAAFNKKEKDGLASYYQGLTESLTAMGEMRHDIKNIFFTMGNFVDRSDDQEMKTFFWEKIYRYSLDTIRQSELLSMIYEIPNESLQAFLHLKCSQMQTQKILVRLEVQLIPEQYQVGMDVIDLTRILGILLDNAMEEAQQVQEGYVEIKITATESGCSYIIRNPVTEQIKANGVHTEVTTKGHGHGQGLLIVRQLLEQYDYVSLSSLLLEGEYTQSLSVYASEK